MFGPTNFIGTTTTPTIASTMARSGVTSSWAPGGKMLLSRPPPLRFDVKPELCDWWIWRSIGPFKLSQRGPGAGFYAEEMVVCLLKWMEPRFQLTCGDVDNCVEHFNLKAFLTRLEPWIAWKFVKELPDMGNPFRSKKVALDAPTHGQHLGTRQSCFPVISQCKQVPEKWL